MAKCQIWYTAANCDGDGEGVHRQRYGNTYNGEQIQIVVSVASRLIIVIPSDYSTATAKIIPEFYVQLIMVRRLIFPLKNA